MRDNMRDNTGTSEEYIEIEEASKKFISKI